MPVEKGNALRADVAAAGAVSTTLPSAVPHTATAGAAPLGGPPSPSPAPRRSAPAAVSRLLPGLLVVLPLAGIATGLGHLVPVVGGPVFGILLGVVVTAVTAPTDRLAPGVRFASKRLLQLSVVLLGTGLSLSAVAHTGLDSLPVMLGTLAVALGGAAVLGKLLRVGPDARTLIGVGTGICGASAIAAVTSVIRVAEAEVAYAIGTIFTFNVAAVLLFPPLGHLFGLSQDAFGLWAGTAINDTSSVVAAGYTYGAHAGDAAVAVKLTRTIMIVPICLALAVWQARRAARTAPAGNAPGGAHAWRKVFPLFILGFLAAAALQTVGAIPAGWHDGLSTTSLFLITTALTAIGLSTRVATLRRAGARPLLLGGALWFAVGVSSLLLQLATGKI